MTRESEFSYLQDGVIYDVSKIAKDYVEKWREQQVEDQADSLLKMAQTLVKTQQANDIMRGQCQGFQQALRIVAAELRRGK